MSSAVVCVIVGGHCEQLASLNDDDFCCHVWRDAKAEDVAAAYQAALKTVGRGDDYRPFTQLRWLKANVCPCTSPSVWHALLALMRAAVHLRCVTWLASNDSLVVCALGYLPSLAMLSAGCVWPPSFTAWAMQRSLRTLQLRFVSSPP